MAYLVLNASDNTDRVTTVTTVVMTSIVGVAAFELWGRHLAPGLLGQELSFAMMLQVLFGIESRLFAEMIYFGIAFPSLPLLYFLIWRPIMRTLIPFKHWFIDGSFFGLVLVGLATALTFLISLSNADFIPTQSTFLAWISGFMATGLATAGFSRLRELGSEII